MSEHHQTGERAVLAHKWIPGRVQKLLDAGCDDGNNAFLLSKKSERTWGIDVNRKAIEAAQKNFPLIPFSCCPVENTPFENEFFDVIVMNDVLEHVRDETVAINEMFRILKKGGQLIISTPHKGMFSFLDPANVKFVVKNKLLLRMLYGKKKTEKFLKNGLSRNDFHRHYSLGQFRSMLRASDFSGQHRIEKIYRSGLLLGILSVDLKILLKRVIGNRLSNLIMYPLFKLATLEYWVPFGPLAYNISISVRKNG